jgi:predicted CoA-binding protein
MNNIAINPKEILRAATRILLIDWPDIDVPGILLKEGFIVYGYSPHKYTRIEMSTGEGRLIFRELEGAPGDVDIVNIYRPEQEHADILSKHVLPLGATVVWLEPPITSQKTHSLAVEHGLKFVEGISISEAARK